MRIAVLFILLGLAAGLAAQPLVWENVGQGHFSGNMGIYASGDTLAIVFYDNPGEDPTQTGWITFSTSVDGGGNWNTTSVVQTCNCLTRPTLYYSSEEIIITYTNGTKCLLARSTDGGTTWSTWPGNPDLNIGKTFENSPLVERREGDLRWISLDIPYPEYNQDGFCLPNDYEQLQAPLRFTDNEISNLGTPVYFSGMDDLDGIVRANSDLKIKQSTGWPVFNKPVITGGEVISWSGTYPEDEVFLDGLIENAPQIGMNGSMRQGAVMVGPTAYDPDNILMVEVSGSTYTAWLGQIQPPVTHTAEVYANYPPAPGDQPLYTNTYATRDTLWTLYNNGVCVDRTLFVNSKLWIKGTFSGQQTWAAVDTVYLIGQILLSDTPAGTEPSYTSTDRVNIISEQSILLKYGYRSPIDSQRYHPFCGANTEPLYIYAHLYAMGPDDPDNISSGVFSFEYQHPHPSVPDYNLNGTLYNNIDLHRYHYPQTPEFPWASVNTPGNPNLKIDLPWYNPLWPEATPYLERGTISIWGSVNQTRRGFLHRSYYDTEYPNDLGSWNPAMDLCGGSSSPSFVGHYDPVLGISLTNANYPGATGSGVGYKREFHNDPRNSLYASRYYPNLLWDHSSPWQTGLAVYTQVDSTWERLYDKNQLNRTRTKNYARSGATNLYSVNEFLFSEQNGNFSDWSQTTTGGGLIRSMAIALDGSALICQHHREGVQDMLRIRKLNAGTGTLAWERDEQVGSLLNDVAILPNGQQIYAKYETNGYLRLWLLDPPAADQLVEVWQLGPYSPSFYDLPGSRLYLKPVDNSTLDIFLALKPTDEGEYHPVEILHARASFTVPADDPQAPPVPEARLNAWPNPSSGTTHIKLETELPQDCVLGIYNLKGQLIRSLEFPSPAGERVFQWNGLDNNRQPVSSGIYFLRLSRGGRTLLSRRICRV